MQSKYDNAFTVLCESLIETGQKEDKTINQDSESPWLTI